MYPVSHKYQTDYSNQQNSNQQHANQGMKHSMGKDMTKANPYYANQDMNNPQNPYIAQNTNNTQAPLNQNPYIAANSGFSTAEILTGALIGAAATYVLTNENVQKTLFKGALSIGDIFSGGLDEMKERFEDAKAEREAAKKADNDKDGEEAAA